MSAWQVYWIMQADSVCVLFGLVGIVGTILLLISFVSYAISNHDEYMRRDGWDKVWANFMKIGWVVLPSLVIFVLLPSTKTICAMIAIPTVVNNETIQQDLADVYKLGMEKLKDQLKPVAEQE